MVNRVVSVDEAFTLPPPVRAKLSDDLGASSPGDVLGILAHNPASQEQYTNPNGTTFTAVAPGALVVTFVAPSTGRVTVQLEAQIHVCVDNGGFWALMSAGAVVQGSRVRVTGPVTADQGGRRSATVVVGGLTPGVSYTYEWATAATSTGTFSMRAGGTTVGAALSGPAVMIVRRAPGA